MRDQLPAPVHASAATAQRARAWAWPSGHSTSTVFAKTTFGSVAKGQFAPVVGGTLQTFVDLAHCCWPRWPLQTFHKPKMRQQLSLSMYCRAHVQRGEPSGHQLQFPTELATSVLERERERAGQIELSGLGSTVPWPLTVLGTRPRSELAESGMPDSDSVRRTSLVFVHSSGEESRL